MTEPKIRDELPQVGVAFGAAGDEAVSVSAADPLPVAIISGGGSGGLTNTELRATPVPVTDTANETLIGAVTETAPATDTASSGLNGRLQRLAQRITSLIALLPTALGSAAAASSLAVTSSTEDVARVGSVTETAPATDTASSGLNGRLQRVAQRLTSLIALLPTALGSAAQAASLSVAQSTEEIARQGIITETAPATDTASSGLNGRLQRIAQRVTSLIALLPTALGSAAAASSLAVTASTEDVARQGIITETAPASDTASSGQNGRLQRIAQRITSLIALLPAALGAGGGLKVDGSGTALPVSGPLTSAELLADLRSTGTHSSVNSGTSSVTILASNASRKGARIFNSDANALYLDLSGGTAVAASRAQVKLATEEGFDVPFGNTGTITGIWAADGAGVASVVEFA
jgi:hypothetical protein